MWRHLFGALAENHALIRYDERGTGLSDRNIEDVSLEGWVSDLEAVVNALDLKEFALMGISQGGPTAVQYAVRHPERVSQLILYGTFARVAGGEDTRLPLLDLVKAGWGNDNPAFRQVFTSLFIPDANSEQMRWFNELERVSASPETAAKILEEIWRIDVRDILAAVETPTIVMHRRGDNAVVFENGRTLAGLIPSARFVPLEGSNHYFLEQEPAFETFLDIVEQFLGQTAARRRRCRPQGHAPCSSQTSLATPK